MAKIRDLKQRLETQEGESGEALIKTLQKALDEVYVDSKGWQKFVGTQNKGVVTKDTDRLWEETYKEILSESGAQKPFRSFHPATNAHQPYHAAGP